MGITRHIHGIFMDFAWFYGIFMGGDLGDFAMENNASDIRGGIPVEVQQKSLWTSHEHPWAMASVAMWCYVKLDPGVSAMFRDQCWSLQRVHPIPSWPIESIAWIERSEFMLEKNINTRNCGMSCLKPELPNFDAVSVEIGSILTISVMSLTSDLSWFTPGPGRLPGLTKIPLRATMAWRIFPGLVHEFPIRCTSRWHRISCGPCGHRWDEEKVPELSGLTMWCPQVMFVGL